MTEQKTPLAAGAPPVPPVAQPPASPVPGAPPAGAPAPPAPDAAPGSPYATFHTQAAFDERLERATRAKLRELGVNPEQAKKDATELAEMKAAEEKRRAEQMSELEKAQAEAEKAKVAVAEAEAKAAASAKTAETAQLAAAHRVADLGYLAFRLESIDADQDRDEWLTKLLEDPVERTRFGVAGGEEVAGDDPKKKASTTSTPKGGGAPAPGGSGAPEDAPKTAMSMTQSEFADYKRQKYGGGGAGVRKGYKPPPR